MHHILQETRQDDKEVQAIPRVRQIGVLATHPHGHHLDGHFQGKEREDDVVEDLKRLVFWLLVKWGKVFFKLYHMYMCNAFQNFYLGNLGDINIPFKLAYFLKSPFLGKGISAILLNISPSVT